MSCLPTSPCYTGGTVVPSGTNCGADPCDNKLKVSGLIKYVGPDLPCTGINNCDDLTTVIQKLEEALCSLTTTTTTTSTSSTSTSTSTTTTTTTALPRFSFSSIFLGGTSCGPVTTATMRWATASPPTIGTFIYQNFAMTIPVADGWYMNSTGDMSYQVTGGLGEVTNTQSCP